MSVRCFRREISLLSEYCFASDAADMLALAGVFMLLAAVSVFLVKEHKAQ